MEASYTFIAKQIYSAVISTLDKLSKMVLQYNEKYKPEIENQITNTINDRKNKNVPLYYQSPYYKDFKLIADQFIDEIPEIHFISQPSILWR